VNCLNINATDQLTNAHGVIYDLVYIIEFDSTSRSIINVYLRQDAEFIKVDGSDISSRSSTIDSQGIFLTLWLSRSTTNTIPQSHNDTFLSPPQSASSSSQIISNSATTTEILNPPPLESTITFDDLLMPSNTTLPDDDDYDQFWNSFGEQSTATISENISTTTTDNDTVSDNTSALTKTDSVSDIYLTLLHSSKKDSSPIKNRTEHDRTVNTLASDIIWPLIVDQTNKRTSRKSSSSTTTTQSLSSNSSIRDSMNRANRYKQLSSTVKARRPHPYTTA